MKTTVQFLIFRIRCRFFHSALFAVSVFALSAQNFASHVLHDAAKKTVSIGNRVFTCVMTETGPLDFSAIFAHSSDGTFKWKQNIVKHEVTTVYHMAVTADKCLVFCGYAEGCDFLDNKEKAFMMKLDTNGNVLVDMILPLAYSNPLGLETSPDNSVWLYNPTEALHIGPTGNVISTVFMGMNISALTVLNVQKISVHGNGVLAIKNNFGAQLLQTSLPGPVKKIRYHQSSGSIYAWKQNNSIDRLDTLLNLLSSYSNTQVALADFIVQNNALHLIGTSGSGTVNYIKTNSAFNAIAQYTNNFPNFSPVSVCEVQGKVAICFNFYKNNYQFANLGNYGRHWGLLMAAGQEDFKFRKDAGIEAMTLVDGYFTKNSFVHLNYTVRIKNYGTDTLKSVYLNGPVFVPNCRKHRYYHEFKGLLIPPQGVQNISTGYISGYHPYHSSTTPTIPSLCFFTTAPDMQMDAYPGNDMFCNPAYTLQVVTDMGEEVLNQLTIAPNPFSNLVTITGLAGAYSFVIMDLTGKRIWQTESEENRIQLPSDLVRGIYVAEVRQGENTRRVKIVKE